MADVNPDSLILYSACICCFSALYTEFPALIGCSGKEECLCIEEELCCKAGTAPLPVGLKTGDGYICKLELYCCSCGLKIPTIICKGKGQCFCCVQQAAFPPDNDVPMMCAVCFLACLPGFGFFKTVADIKGGAK